MPEYYLKGGTIIWPLLLSSVAARAVLSLAATYGPAVGEYPEGYIEADLEAVMWVIVNLVSEKRLSGPGLSLSTWKEREAEVLNDLLPLSPASRKRSHTLADTRKTVFG